MRVRNRHHQATMREKLRAHLFALTIASLRAGCRVESSLQNLHHPHHAQLTALQGTHGNPWSNQVRFDSDSFPIGVDNHALYCYVNSPHLLEDLVLSNKGSEDGITDGLPIKGKGTFEFTIGDDNGRRHNTRVPESLYVPGMKKCLLSPQHWVQTAADKKKTWMEILMIAAFCFGMEARRPFPSVPRQMFQPFSWLLLCARIKHLPQRLKPVRPHFSRGRPSFKFLDARF
jgi:hypothetical protein